MLPLLQLSRAAVRSSCGKYKPPNWKLGSRVTSTTSADLTTSPRLRSPTIHSQHYSSIRPRQDGTTGGALLLHRQQHLTVPSSPGRVIGVDIIRAEASSVHGVYSGLLQAAKGKLPAGIVLFQRNISGSGQNLMPSRFTKKEVSSWLRLNRVNNMWGRFSGSRVRHYGQGPPLAFVIVIPVAMNGYPLVGLL